MASVGFMHSSPAAIPPLNAYYKQHAQDLDVTNVLDDGLLRLLARRELEKVRERFVELIEGARRWYRIRAAILACSGVPHTMTQEIAREAGLPVLKIDDALAVEACAFRRVGVVVTFAPALAETRALLMDAARTHGRDLELEERLVGGAYSALLGGDSATHDRLLIEAASELLRQGVDALVLSQVSMARVQEPIAARASVPVLSSLSTSLPAIRSALAETA
jgi:aspartate/glutamate racemase